MEIQCRCTGNPMRGQGNVDWQRNVNPTDMHRTTSGTRSLISSGAEWLQSSPARLYPPVYWKPSSAPMRIRRKCCGDQLGMHPCTQRRLPTTRERNAVRDWPGTRATDADSKRFSQTESGSLKKMLESRYVEFSSACLSQGCCQC